MIKSKLCFSPQGARACIDTIRDVSLHVSSTLSNEMECYLYANK